MDMNEQLERILANLGVEMEQPPAEEADSSPPVATIFQSSHEQYGVFYRLDLRGQQPQLRVIVPVESGTLKVEQYLVRLSECAPAHRWLADLLTYSGSAAFERGREALVYHLLQAVGGLMQDLFWAGDLESRCFPPEIAVQHLI